MLLQTIQDMLKQARAGKMVSEDDIPPPVAMPASHAVAEPAVGPAAPARQAPAPASIEIPRPAIVGVGDQAAAMPPVAKPRSSVQSAVQPPTGSGPVPGASINAAQAAVNAPPVQLHSGPASAHRPPDTGNLRCFYFCSICRFYLFILVKFK